MPRVFLNYRREDSAGIAGRLFDRAYDYYLKAAKRQPEKPEIPQRGGPNYP